MNDKIFTYKQFSALLLITVITTGFIIIPFISGSILSVAGGLLLGFAYILMYRNVSINNNIVKYIFSFKLMLTSGILLGIFSEIARDIFLKNANVYYILIIAFLVTLYCSYSDKSIGSAGRMLFIFILLPVVSVILFSLRDIKLYNLISSINRFNILDVFTISIVSLIYEIVFLLGKFTDKNMSSGNIVKPVLFSICILFLSTICITGRFGISVYNYKYPSFELMYSSDLPGYIIQRQEGILIPLFLMGLLVVISLYMLLSLKFKAIGNKKAVNYIIIFLIAAASICCKNIIDLYVIINFFGGIVIMLLSFIYRGVKCEK